MARPRKEDARDTRRLILEAALDLFSQSGFAGTSMRQIARAVSVRESALYHHFSSKADILEALLDELGPGRSKQLDGLDVAHIVSELGGEKALRLLARSMVALWATPSEQKLARLILAEGPRLTALGIVDPRALMLEARGRLERVIGAIAEATSPRAKLDVPTATLSFLGPLVVLRLLHLVLAPGPPDLPALNREVDRHVAHFSKTFAKLNKRS